MKKELTVLSLFDGMSGAQQALERAGIPVKTYYASEIDKHAIKVTMANYPDTIQLGSVVDVDVFSLPEIPQIIFAGSPCQSFSFAGKRKGMATKCEQEILTLDKYLELKSEGFQFEGQSYLFWEFMRILTDVRKINPDVKFLLENVLMGEKWEKVLTAAVGVNPIEINSALVSAQNRKRLYWANIGMQPAGLFGDLESVIQQPKDRGLLLKDVLETNVDEKFYLSEKALNYLDRALMNQRFIQSEEDEKGGCITANYHKGVPYNALCVASRGRNPENPKSRQSGLPTEQQLEPRKDGKTNCLTSVQKDNLVMQINPSKESNGCQPFQQNRVYDPERISPALMAQMSSGTHAIIVPEATKKGFVEINPGECFDAENLTSSTSRGRKMEEKSNCLMASETNFMQYTNDFRIRRLTPTECERLQTVKDGYTSCVSDTQRYKMLGNGWTIEVIAHILSYLK